MKFGRWRARRSLAVILNFMVVWILICGVVAIFQTLLSDQSPAEAGKSYIENLGSNALFFLGYGESSRLGLVTRNILAVVGILAISIMTTFLTINLFWRVDDVLVSPYIYVYENNARGKSPYSAAFVIENAGKKIANLRLSVIAYHVNQDKESGMRQAEYTQISKSREHTYPMLLSKSRWIIEEGLQDSFLMDLLFRQHQLMDKREKDCIQVFLILYFLDPNSGQECCNIAEFPIDNLIWKNPQDLPGARIHQKKKNKRHVDSSEVQTEILSYITNPVKNLDFNRLEVIPWLEEASLVKEVRVQQGKAGSVPEDGISIHRTGMARFDSSRSSDRFLILYFDYKSKPLDWTIYDDHRVSFVCDLSVTGNINQVALELKCGDPVSVVFREELQVKEGRAAFQMSLKTIKEQAKNADFSAIRELAFVIDRGENLTKDVFGTLSIQTCAIRYDG